MTPPQGSLVSVMTACLLSWCSVLNYLNLICNMTTFRKRYSLTFWPHPLGRGCVCGQNICYHVAASVVSLNSICNMTTFRKRYSLTFWPYPLGRGCVCLQNICYHVAASVASFNLICNMTIFWKSLILTSAPPPKSTQQARTQDFKLKSRLICFISIAALPVCKISAKNINNCLSYCEIYIFDLYLRGQRGGVKLWHCHAYLQALGNHDLIVRIC